MSLTTDGGADRGLPGFVRRHPYVTFLVIFNTLGQAVAFVPVILARKNGTAPDAEPFLIISTLLFLLLPALVITRVAWGGDALHALVRSMFRFRVRGWWYLLPMLVVPAVTLLAAPPVPPALTPTGVLAAYLTVYLPGLLVQFATTNWWEETVWMGFFQAPLQHRFGPWRALLLTTPFFALEHLSLVAGGTVGEGLVQLGLIVVVIVPTRALLAWMYNRTGSLALTGLVHAASNAAGISLVPQLFGHAGGGGAALVLLGVIAIIVSRGRLGWQATPSGPDQGGPHVDRPHRRLTQPERRVRAAHHGPPAA